MEKSLKTKLSKLTGLLKLLNAPSIIGAIVNKRAHKINDSIGYRILSKR